MDKSNRIIMLLGSNRDAEENMKLAEAELRDYFPQIAFSTPVYTEPVGTNYNTPFLNRIAVAYTSDRPEEIIVCFKLIEQVLGRTPSDKLIGSIPIDIDLLQWNDQELKKEDLKRDYVIDGIRSLSSK
jgi:2-amino-4-hydroxy-6-hydroxymethyldihydropteridine diphosphokinase